MEDFTLDEQWKLFLRINPPPPDMAASEVESFKWFFACGVGSMLMFAKRLETESKERREGIYAQLEKDVITSTGAKLC